MSPIRDRIVGTSHGAGRRTSQYASARGAGRTSSLSWDQLAISSTQLGRVFMSGTVGAVTRAVMGVQLDGEATAWTSPGSRFTHRILEGNLCQNRERQTPKGKERTDDPRREPARGLAVPGETGSWEARPEEMDTRQRDREKDKEKEMAPGERTPNVSGNTEPRPWPVQHPSPRPLAGLFFDRTWTMVREKHREDSGHGKMCGEWVIVDRCEVLIAYCATCELMLD
ncbi:hypothetical protein F2Q70_00021712 [Brassica cretica]|nr:hypothetical protein F2Q70_00021712 [Brassica cretica]